MTILYIFVSFCQFCSEVIAECRFLIQIKYENNDFSGKLHEKRLAFSYSYSLFFKKKKFQSDFRQDGVFEENWIWISHFLLEAKRLNFPIIPTIQK